MKLPLFPILGLFAFLKSAYAVGRVRVKVFDDVNGDGTRETGVDENLPGVTVKIMAQADDTEVASAVTGNNGRVDFTSLTEGDYYVQVELPDQLHAFTEQDAANTARNRDSDVDQDGKTPPFTLGTNNVNRGAGILTPDDMEVIVWDDSDGDGERNDDAVAGEPRLSEIIVWLLRVNPEYPYMKEIAFERTDATGVARFVGMVPATGEEVKIRIDPPPGYGFTPPTTASLQIFQVDDSLTDSDCNLSGETLPFAFNPASGNEVYVGLDCGLLSPGTVTARAWKDNYDQDNEYDDANDFLLPGVLVTVRAADTHEDLDTCTTDASGTCELVAPADRAFYVNFAPVQGVFYIDKNYSSTSDVDGSTGNTDSVSAQISNEVYMFSAGYTEGAS